MHIFIKNTLKSLKILSPRHVSDHTRIHPQGAITRSWLKYLQVHGASPYSRLGILYEFNVFFNKYVHELGTIDTVFLMCC